MWMCGCKRRRTVRRSIRIFWYHMVSEASVERFVLRARAGPSCTTECVKIHFHVQREEPETTMLTVTSRVFDRWTPKFICGINNACEGIVLGWQPRTTSQVWVIFCPHHGEDRKGPDKPGCIVFLVRCSTVYTPSHVLPEVCTFSHPPAASCQRIGPVVLQALWNHGENLSESFVTSLFVRCSVWSSVLVLKMSCSTAASPHKSWSSWLCIRNPSSPPRSEVHCRLWGICSCLFGLRQIGPFGYISAERNKWIRLFQY